MTTAVAPLLPLAEIEPHPSIAVLPKADLHVHQEWSQRLARVLARRQGRPPYDWRAWAAGMMAATPPGMPRLRQLGQTQLVPEVDASPDLFVARVADLLAEAAAAGAILVEVRFGKRSEE